MSRRKPSRLFLKSALVWPGLVSTVTLFVLPRICSCTAEQQTFTGNWTFLTLKEKKKKNTFFVLLYFFKSAQYNKSQISIKGLYNPYSITTLSVFRPSIQMRKNSLPNGRKMEETSGKSNRGGWGSSFYFILFYFVYSQNLWTLLSFALTLILTLHYNPKITPHKPFTWRDEKLWYF